MLYFLFFILGVICTQYIFPLLDSLFEILLTKLEIYKGKNALQITAQQLEIEKLVHEEEDGPLQPAIGFQYTPDEEELDDV